MRDWCNGFASSIEEGMSRVANLARAYFFAKRTDCSAKYLIIDYIINI